MQGPTHIQTSGFAEEYCVISHLSKCVLFSFRSYGNWLREAYRWTHSQIKRIKVLTIIDRLQHLFFVGMWSIIQSDIVSKHHNKGCWHTRVLVPWSKFNRLNAFAVLGRIGSNKNRRRWEKVYLSIHCADPLF